MVAPGESLRKSNGNYGGGAGVCGDGGVKKSLFVGYLLSSGKSQRMLKAKLIGWLFADIM